MIPITDPYQEAVNLFTASKFEEAERILINFTCENQLDYDAYNFLGIIKLNQKDYETAVLYLGKVMLLNPGHITAAYNLGLAYQHLHDLDEAIHWYEYCLGLDPNYFNSLLNLACIYKAKKKPSTSETYLKKIIELDPGNGDAWNNIASILLDTGRTIEALEAYKKAITCNPMNPDYYTNAAAACIKLNYAEESVNYLRKAFESSTDFCSKNEISELLAKVTSNENTAALITNLAVEKAGRKQFQEAVELCIRALSIDENHLIRYNLAHIQLLNGQYEEGWINYEARKERKDFIKRVLKGDELKDLEITGKTIFVYDEQGLGDSIHFVRYLELLKKKGCKIVFECDPRLYFLYRDLTFCDIIIPRSSYTSEPGIPYDYQISLLSLPLYFNTNLTSIPCKIPYLNAHSELSAALGKAVRENRAYKIGIAWAGNPKHTNDKNRSCTLKDFKRLLEIDGTFFCSLQKGEPVKQIKKIALPILDLDSKGLNDFAQTAAMIENLDLVISVDTSVAHLAGAMGKKVWLLLPFIPDWRWLTEGETTQWYPTMRLFRQSEPGNWREVFEKIERELKNEIVKSHRLMDNSGSNKQIVKEKRPGHDVLYLGLSSGENFGWGVCSKYLRKELRNFIKTIDVEN